MRKAILFTAIVALIALVSCTKEEPVKDANSTPNEFIATIDIATKVSADGSGKLSWDETDEITIQDASRNRALYKINKINSDGKATFVLKNGETALGPGPYSATYGQYYETKQTYSDGSITPYMTAPSTETNELTFSVDGSILSIKLTKAGESIKDIYVTGTPNGCDETTYDLICENAVSIENGKVFNFALPAGTYDKIDIRNASDIISTVDVNNAIISNNQILSVTFGEKDLDFNPNYAIPDPVDLGLSVKWASFNLGATKPEEFGGYYYWAGLLDYSNTRLICDGLDCPYHIGWEMFQGWTKYVPSEDSSYWSGDGEPDNKKALDPEDDAAKVRLGDKWRMPTEEECIELTENCTAEWISLNGVLGMKLTSKVNGNSIFLPANGMRDVSTIPLIGYCGNYWSSTIGDAEHACNIVFMEEFITHSSGHRMVGRGIRPVSD